MQKNTISALHIQNFLARKTSVPHYGFVKTKGVMYKKLKNKWIVVIAA